MSRKDDACRILELAEQLRTTTDDLLAVCALLEIPVTSRISCLTDEHVQNLTTYYQENSP